jgi:hypothetical protein
LVGPPLTPSAASILVKANVTFGIAIQDAGKLPDLSCFRASLISCSLEGASAIHALGLEASWAAKYAGLSQRAAVDLVSANIETILGLKQQKNKDIVIWEGNPLEFGASVVIAIDGDDGAISSCWPTSN